MKACARCRHEKPRSDFTIARRSRDGLNPWCTACKKDQKLRDRYGITLADRDAMLAAQDGRCAICSVDVPAGTGDWHVDHDHLTGAVRGILCHACNTGLGAFRDSDDLLDRARRYLKASS